MSTKSQDRSIDYLLGKYETKQPGEILSREHECNIKRKQRNTNKHQIANRLMQDLPLKGETANEVHYLIDHYNFHCLHTKANSEKVIGCLCFYVMKSHDNRLQIHYYRVLNNLINYKLYSTVLTNMIKINNSKNKLAVIDKG